MALRVHIFYNSALKGGPGAPEALSGFKTIFITILIHYLLNKNAVELSKGSMKGNQLNAEIW